jgi:predicted transcriptional regulator
MDDLRLSDCTIDEIVDTGEIVNTGEIVDDGSPLLTIRFAAPDTCKNPGGLTLFGEKFGNYRRPLSICFYGRR